MDSTYYQLTLNYNTERFPLKNRLPILYGFELCKDNKFEEKSILRVGCSVNDEFFRTYGDDHKWINVYSKYEDCKVTFTLEIDMPLTNIFWNEEKEVCYVRPFIYESTGIYNYGQYNWYYKKGGPSDPNRGH